MENVTRDYASTVWARCYLCRRKKERTRCQYIDSTVCPSSRKTIKQVLQFLARYSKSELHIARTDCICGTCFDQLVEYDTELMRLLQKQKTLVALVEKAAVWIDSDCEEECNSHMASMEEFQSDRIFDDISVSENEIDQTVEEAIWGEPKGKSKETFLEISMKDQGKQYPCNFCALHFKSKDALQRHVSHAHQRYTCELCPFSHRNEDYVLLHMNLHEGRSENQCRFCDKEFTTKISTIRHMEVHLDTKKYQCDKCGLCFSQTTVLYNHKLQHEAEEKPLRCDICKQMFKTKRTFRHHMITHREDRPRHSCDICGKTFTEKYTLKVHKRNHMVANEEVSDQTPQQTIEVTTTTESPQTSCILPESKFHCIICDQVFTSKDNLNKHMEKEHDVILKSLTLTNFTQYEVVTQEPRKSCHICGQMFSVQVNLDIHLVEVHGVSFK